MTAPVLMTGGAGYIGSHTVLALLQAGHPVVVLDNLCNSSPEALARVARIAGRAPVLVQGNVRDASLLRRVLADHGVGAVLHFAGLKAVGESVREPLRYYANNVAGTMALCQAMQDAGVFTLVFSSSATVYGEPAHMPISEATPTGRPTNPYGCSKLMVEELLADLPVGLRGGSRIGKRRRVGACGRRVIGYRPRRRWPPWARRRSSSMRSTWR